MKDFLTVVLLIVFGLAMLSGLFLGGFQTGWNTLLNRSCRFACEDRGATMSYMNEQHSECVCSNHTVLVIDESQLFAEPDLTERTEP